ncbi:MAG: hypothetical protein ACTSSF_09750 [Candidatus Heimdallarchaeaceae archaeon]
MTLLKIIIKAKRKEIIFEMTIILVVLIVSFFSFAYFMEKYKSNWNKLISDSDTTDFEVSINLNNSQFLSEYNTINRHFNDFNHKFFTHLPNNLIKLKINNITSDTFSLFLVNNHLSSENLLNIKDQESLLIVKTSNPPNIDSIEIKWSLNTSKDFFNVSQIVGESYLTKLLGTSKYLEILQETSTYNILLKDSDFFSFVDDIGLSEIKSVLNEERIKLFSLYSMNKTAYLYQLPVKLRKGYDKWVSILESEFLQFFDYFSVQKKYYVDFNFNDIFTINLDNTIKTIRFTLFNSLLFSVPISVFFLYLLSVIIQQDKKEQKKTMNILSSRGVKSINLAKKTILIQSLAAGIVFCISLVLSVLYLITQKMNSYSVNRLIVYISHSVTILCTLLIIQKNGLKLEKTKKFLAEYERKNLSGSELLKVGIIIGMVIIILVSFGAFWTINKFFFESSQISTKTIWITILGLFFFTSLLIAVPIVQIKIINQAIKRGMKLFSPAHETITRTFSAISRKKRRILAVSFYLVFFASLLMTSITSLHNQTKDLNESLRIFDYSLVTKPETSFELMRICGTNNTIVSFIDQVYTFDGLITIIYINNPLKFYENSFFKNVKFEKHSGEEIFTKLNFSSNYVISSSVYVKTKHYFITENITIPRTQPDMAIEYDQNTLYDFAYYLPFYSLNNPAWFLKKYEEIEHNLTSFRYAITSIKKQKNNIEEAINFLDQNNIWYVIKHNDSDLDLTSSSREIVISQLNNAAFIVNILAPIFLIWLLSSLIYESNDNFEFLKLRGLKVHDILKSQVIWLLSFLLLTYIFSIICASTLLGVVFYIHNTLYGLPINIGFSWEIILSFIVSIFVLVILVYLSNSNIITKFLKIQEKINTIIESEKE